MTGAKEEPLYGTKEWVDRRAGKITSSNFIRIISGKNGAQWGTAAIAYAFKIVSEAATGEVVEGPVTNEMQWGIDNEKFALEAYSEATFSEVLPGRYHKKEGHIIGATPDGFIGERGLVEVKCKSSANHLSVLLGKRMPIQHIPQVQGQLWVTGREWCDFVSFDPRFKDPSKRLFIQRVLRDEAFITTMMLTLYSFEELVLEMMKDAGIEPRP